MSVRFVFLNGLSVLYIFMYTIAYILVYIIVILYSDDKNLEIKQVGVFQLMNINLWKLAKKKMY